MARQLRLEYPGALWHVTSRGNERRDIYFDDHDRRSFLEMLADVVVLHDWILHAWVLMRNHYHLLVETPRAPTLSRGVKRLNERYAHHASGVTPRKFPFPRAVSRSRSQLSRCDPMRMREFLIAYMDRHADWAVVVCLVGGGQEINTGEAGIDAWLDAVLTQFPDWGMHISSRLTDSEYAAGHALDAVRGRPLTSFDDCLHLAVSMRSFRAEHVSSFVKCVLDREHRAAAEMFERLGGRYPMAVTRDLGAAKQWVREHARGSERFGLVASSKAQRLKPHAIDIRVDVDPVCWFLNGKDDTRSSYYLEDAATEFQVQGLELDWACVTWDADLRFHSSGWGYHDFRGSKWQNVKSLDNQRYLLNAYRVLLTRARQGMVIFVPPGERTDPTRPPEYYDATFRYLAGVGVEVIG